MTSIPAQCQACKHFQADRLGYFCTAFPDEPGIPDDIIEMEHDHREPFPGDHGIQWEPIKPGGKHPMEDD